ncbi:hypothetical protein [Reticulibacter mediterranei]|uniref:hypothetical protein n=1 Tax=Reticulibacter mediterranei TaxID=2778369 RepID=UPI001C68A6AC|nr:hypothetical protein [Reticulibacter mediterranei]
MFRQNKAVNHVASWVNPNIPPHFCDNMPPFSVMISWHKSGAGEQQTCKEGNAGTEWLLALRRPEPIARKKPGKIVPLAQQLVLPEFGATG